MNRRSTSGRTAGSLLLALGGLIAVWSASAVVGGLYWVAQGKYVNGVMFGALVLGTALFIGSVVAIRRGWRMARSRAGATVPERPLNGG